MAATLINETELIEVSNPPVLIYGQPGAGKTSLAQSAGNSLTLDFDGGAHRSQFRRKVLRFDSWDDVVEVDRRGLKDRQGNLVVLPHFGNFDVLALDTIGTLLKYASRSIIADNPKMGNRSGGLSQNGWGVLKDTFDAWIANLRAAGKQVVMIAHEKEEKEGDGKTKRPDISGGSYAIAMNNADIVGYLSYRGDRRWLAWDPTDAYFAKNGARLRSGPVPSLTDEPDFLSKVLAEAKANLGATAAASAAVAQAVGEWQTWLDSDPTLDDVHSRLPKLGELTNGTKRQVWHIVQAALNAKGYTFDRDAKRFVANREAA